MKDKKLAGKVIFAKHIGTDPKNVVNAIIQHIERNPKIQFEKLWSVFDRDSWPKDNVNTAIEIAKKNNICVAISNEAYELWILLHFEKLTRFTNRKELNSKLKEHFISSFGQEYDKSSKDVYRLIIGSQAFAISNAEFLVQKHIRDNGKLDVEINNPVTLVYQLVKCLNTLYKENPECECFPFN